MSNVIQFPEPKKGSSGEIVLVPSDLVKYLVQRGTFSKDYGSQMKEGQEQYLLSGLLLLMNGSEEFEITVVHDFFGDRERLSIMEPYAFLNPMGHSSPSSVVFEVYKHYGFKVFLSHSSNGHCGFHEGLRFHKKINTSAIKKYDRTDHFIDTLSCDPDPESMHESDTPTDGELLFCPICKSKMMLRKGPHGSFYGCSKYPSCRGTRKVKKDNYYAMQPVMMEEYFDESPFEEAEGNPIDFGDHD